MIENYFFKIVKTTGMAVAPFTGFAAAVGVTAASPGSPCSLLVSFDVPVVVSRSCRPNPYYPISPLGAGWPGGGVFFAWA